MTQDTIGFRSNAKFHFQARFFENWMKIGQNQFYAPGAEFLFTYNNILNCYVESECTDKRSFYAELLHSKSIGFNWIRL